MENRMDGAEIVEVKNPYWKVAVVAIVFVAVGIVLFLAHDGTNTTGSAGRSDNRAVMRTDTVVGRTTWRLEDAILAAKVSAVYDDLETGKYVSDEDMKTVVDSYRSSTRYAWPDDFKGEELAKLEEKNAALWRDAQTESKFEKIDEVYEKIEAFKKASGNRVVSREVRVEVDHQEPLFEIRELVFYDYSAKKDVRIQYKDGEFYCDEAKIDDRGFLNPSEDALPIDEPTPVAPLATSAETGKPISSEPNGPWGPVD